MAFYDLHCQTCGCTFELYVQGFLKDEHKVCPECGSREVEQQLSGGFLRVGARGSAGRSSGECSPSGFS